MLPEHNLIFFLGRLSYDDVYAQQVRAGHVHCKLKAEGWRMGQTGQSQ